MCSVSRICYLLHLASKKKIVLPHEQPTTVGRSEETQIQDPYVSKKQIECVADINQCTVRVKPLGNNISGIDGYATVKNKTYTLGHGHIIELRLGNHQFEVVFEPPPEENTNHVAKKPKLEFPIFSISRRDSSTSENNEKPNFTGNGTWENIDNKELLIYTSDNLKASNNIAGFDMDGTIIKTKSGRTFPKDTDDWTLNYSSIPNQLKSLYEEGYKIVFFTNQSGVGKDSFKIKNFKKKIEGVSKIIALPIQVFIALGKGIYRKPLLGMWNLLQDKKNDDVKIDLNKSFYVGDAAGRAVSKQKKDHSLVDRLFALNIGIKFYTPEEYFLKSSSESYTMPEFDPRYLPSGQHPDIDYEDPNVIIMVGLQGSGKSHFCKKVLVPKGYSYINRDSLGSWQKCAKVMEETIKDKKSCVIDNTNIDKESRKRFIDIAKKYNVDCRCFVMATNIYQTKHNNKFRELIDKSHEPVSEMIINTAKKNYQEPDMTEGFKEIVHVKFVPEFENEEHEKMYKMFLLEK